jgi:hypothetical protein
MNGEVGGETLEEHFFRQIFSRVCWEVLAFILGWEGARRMLGGVKGHLSLEVGEETGVEQFHCQFLPQGAIGVGWIMLLYWVDSAVSTTLLSHDLAALMISLNFYIFFFVLGITWDLLRHIVQRIFSSIHLHAPYF